MLLMGGRWVSEIKIKNVHGHVFNLLDLRAEDVPIDVLAHQMAQINRFNGAAIHPYSVATHSVLVALLLPDQFQYDGLMHDCTEATGIGDMISPVKEQVLDFQILEDYIRPRLARIYGFSAVEPVAVEAADKRARKIESHYLQGAPEPDAFSKYERDLGEAMILAEIPWKESMRLFLNHYEHCRKVRRLDN